MEQTGIGFQYPNMMMQTEDSLIDQIFKLSMSIQTDILNIFTKINKLNTLNFQLSQLRKNNTMMGNMNMMRGMNMNTMNNDNSVMGNNMMAMNTMSNSSDDLNDNNMNNNMIGNMNNMNNNMSNLLSDYSNMMNTMNMNLMNLMNSNQNNPNVGDSNLNHLANPLANMVSTTLYDPGISVIINKNGTKTTIPCKLNDKVSDIIEKYKNATSDKSKNLKFIYNAKKLNEDLLVSEAGLVDGSVIFVIS